MKRDELAQAADPEAIVARVTEQAAELPQQDQGHEHGQGSPTGSTREVTYRGHHILIRTTYHIEVDGMPIQGHLGVTNDGRSTTTPSPTSASPPRLTWAFGGWTRRPSMRCRWS